MYWRKNCKKITKRTWNSTYCAWHYLKQKTDQQTGLHVNIEKHKLKKGTTTGDQGEIGEMTKLKMQVHREIKDIFKKIVRANRKLTGK